MIGRLHTVVFDCPDPHALAGFYCEVLGARQETADDRWVTIVDGQGRRLSFQRSPGYRPPAFPDPAASQQLHLDVMVDDVDEAERKVLDLGARRLDGEGEDFRVYADPVGHPFCLVWQN